MPSHLDESALMSKLTTFVLRSSTQAKAEDGGFSLNVWAKSKIKKVGSYRGAS
jgi:hypothetical protein